MKTAFRLKFFLVLTLISATCDQEDTRDSMIEGPEKIIRLPEILKEISGITDLNNNTIACVQDENGEIFVVDINSGEITNQVKFGEDGDYEGITKVNEIFYVLRSDGLLIEITGFKEGKLRTTFFDTGVPAKNNEGLCYDHFNNRLLIGCKSKPGAGSEYKDIRAIYSFDLKSKEMDTEPAFEFSVSEIEKYAKMNGIKLPEKTKKNTGETIQNFKFGISAITIHPKSGDLYVLCAIDYVLMVFDREGHIEQMQNLPSERFPQAEGITFLGNGKMIITTEGQEGEAKLFVFDDFTNN